MSVIAIYSPKGGVGKSTIAVDLAWRCAVAGGHDTLLWDLDAGRQFMAARPRPGRTAALGWGVPARWPPAGADRGDRLRAPAPLALPTTACAPCRCNSPALASAAGCRC